jgi:CRP-like cAMP-binding protein
MSYTDNLLIQRLPQKARDRLIDQCESVELKASADVGVRGQALRHVHFPTDSFLSLVLDWEDYPGIGIGMVGHEGMVGAEVLLGAAPPPWRATVLGPGHSLRISAKALRQECAVSPTLLRWVSASILLRLHQQAIALACQRVHLLVPRLARWLLMSLDGARCDHFHATHESIAHMLGVRRVGITEAAGALQQSGLIHYHRGEMTVNDRPGLEQQACSCYRTDQTFRQKLFPDPA